VANADQLLAEKKTKRRSLRRTRTKRTRKRMRMTRRKRRMKKIKMTTTKTKRMLNHQSLCVHRLVQGVTLSLFSLRLPVES